jgi:N-acetylglucosamine-6-phosphate deacetylase
MIISNGILFCDDGVFRKTDIEVCEGVITAIGESGADGVQEAFDAEGRYVVPGFVDIHIHGSSGVDFSNGNEASINTMARFLAGVGTTSFLGTSMALSEEMLMAAFSAARPFVGRNVPGQATLRGINMEGPFFNQEKRGAQNEKYIINPDFDMFLRLYEASGQNIRTVAMAPELPGGLDFIKKARHLTNVSLAHSGASYDMAKAAFAAGAAHITHIFNGMSPFLHRDPGIIGAVADSNATVELICDGHHIHPAAVRAVFKLFGEEKVCLISDAMEACGMPDGSYELGDQKVIVGGGTATLEGGTLAGSVATLFDCFQNAVKFGIPVEAAIKATSINPAKAMGLDGIVGSLTRGKQADMLILNRDYGLEKVMIYGEWAS